MADQKKPLEVLNVDAVGPKILAESIIAIDKAMTALNAAPLKRRALVLLIKDSTGVSFADIERVLTGLERLKADYVK